jgi:hypothetical protein
MNVQHRTFNVELPRMELGALRLLLGAGLEALRLFVEQKQLGEIEIAPIRGGKRQVCEAIEPTTEPFAAHALANYRTS